MGLPTIAVPEYTLTIPSTKKEVKYRPFLVKEEKILLLAMESEKTEEIITATKTIIENCVYGDIDVEEMPTFDIEYIFLQLRAKAKGEILELKYKCPKCEGEIPLNILIDDVKIHRQDDHTPDIKLTESKIMNQLSYKVQKIKIEKYGLKLNSKIKKDINNTLKMFKGVKNVKF